MDKQAGPETPPLAEGRPQDADRPGDKDWNPTPGESSVEAALYDPLRAPSQRDLRRAMAGVLRRAQSDAERR